MPIVAVKNKFQVVIPQRVRDEIGIEVGDILEARAENGKIVFEPKTVVDRGIAQSIAEFQAGKGYGPFRTHQAFLKALHKEARTAKRRPRNARRDEG
ncbi:MAG TPA: AbrB/MazE/SpoVT family DNA-binding domain-containing protein [Bryobacteraceae bacterium]|nr:AbrB/MazE/SpoVT family DNA-binding domain-containing protein [Bryobacteraceae bacterium]